ncbi:HAD family hydrolase [Catenovulum sediminis]|uniref:HAD-IIIA family hydrolase n=1 Tax=Catenovulum sediminis TaxID=1740262 RepID=A0ABV1RGS0_9ALTE
MNKYKLVIFDWDGTLMDSIGRIVSSMQNAASNCGVEVPSDALAQSVIGLSLPTAIQTLFPSADETMKKRLSDVYRQEYVYDNPVPTPLFHGVEPLLQQLSEQGYILAVATGKARAGLDRVLKATGLANYFAATICADESESKPSPKMLLSLLQQFDLTANQAVMIGDTVHDLNMANNAGMDAIGVTCGVNDEATLASCKPVAIVHQIHQIKTILLPQVVAEVD